ncbi:MAG TPA: hypothetical protein VHX62_03490 [Solirubrobacteraceae bacterium]|nr:hypothetical protein [Solirubrobacteraceae bacterium]
MAIVGINIPAFDLNESYVNAGSQGQWGGDFYWSSGSSNITPAESGGPAFGLGPFGSSYFGLLVVCGQSTCTIGKGEALINVSELILQVAETRLPAVNGPSGLWQTSGWVRGNWPLVVTGSAPTGMCFLWASLAGQSLPGTSSAVNPATWQECNAPSISDTVYTAAFAQGATTLAIAGVDGADNPASGTKTVYIDNQQPTVALTGPTDAPSTAGTQYVTATAAAGPSGVAGIDCSVDDAPGQWYAGSTVQVPVSGIGDHQISCFAENNAVSADGIHGTSATASFAMKIGTPTVAAIGFDKLVDKLRCHREHEVVRIAAHWVTGTVNGKPVRVHEQARTQRITITRCHVRTARRRMEVWVTVRRHGKTVRVRRQRTVLVAIPPHIVSRSTQLVGHDRATTVDGWIGTDAGVAIAGQTVDIYTAADNGRHNFHLATTTTTAADGGWTARIGPGPSRVIEAYYPGAATIQAAQSAPVTLTVPAKIVLLRITPHRVAWGQTVRILGRLQGGYFPPGGALVRLRIGEGNAYTTYGVAEHVGGHHGLFSTTYTFGAGDPSTYRSFWFELATLPMGDYPYAPANSRRRSVFVGGDPPIRRR